MRIHLVKRGWNRKEIFLDFSVDGISAHEKWKALLGDRVGRRTAEASNTPDAEPIFAMLPAKPRRPGGAVSTRWTTEPVYSPPAAS